MPLYIIYSVTPFDLILIRLNAFLTPDLIPLLFHLWSNLRYLTPFWRRSSTHDALLSAVCYDQFRVTGFMLQALSCLRAPPTWRGSHSIGGTHVSYTRQSPMAAWMTQEPICKAACDHGQMGQKERMKGRRGGSKEEVERKDGEMEVCWADRRSE